MKTKITTKEVKIIDQVINVPLYASGLQNLLQITGLTQEYIIKLHNQISSLIENQKDISVIELNIDKDDFLNLVKVYSTSISIVKDFDDIQTLTGYSEEEVEKLEKKIKGLVVV